jgi:hypothetical protein
MQKFKMLFAAAALVLVSVGVFAGKARFQTLTLYADKSGSFHEVASGVTLFATDYSLTGTVQAQITDKSGTQYPLYSGANTNNPVYAITTY